MSHVVQIRAEIRDSAALVAACRRLRLAEPVQNTFRLFTSTATGLGVQLPGWNYPVVCDTTTGQLSFDNFGGRWGKQAELDKLLQAYAVERAKIEARKRGHTITEQALTDGSIKVVIRVTGGAI